VASLVHRLIADWPLPLRIGACAGLLLLVLVIVLNLVAFFLVNRLMFRPHPSSYQANDRHLTMLAAPNGEIAAFWIPRRGAKLALLYFHGNGEDLGDDLPILNGFLNYGLSVLAVDYPGYGLTPGKPTEREVYRAAEAGYRFLTEEKHFSPDEIAVLGFSIGTGPACYIAEKHPVRALVFQSGFTSAPRVRTRVRLPIPDPFPNIARIRHVKCPKLFLHGENDNVVPYSLGRKVFEAAEEPKLFIGVPDAGHADIPYAMPPGAYVNTVGGFIKRASREKPDK